MLLVWFFWQCNVRFAERDERSRDLNVVETDDLTAPEVSDDPYRYFGRLREKDPVHWNPLAEAWILTAHGDVVRLTRSRELFSSAVAVNDARDTYPPIDEGDRHLNDSFRDWLGDLLTEQDRPAHLEMRQAVHRWFTPRAIENWRAEVRAAVRDLLEEMRPRGRMEVKAELAAPLPLMFICRMLGVPESDAPGLRDLADKVASGRTSASDRMGGAVVALRQLQDYFSPLVKERSEKPQGDLVSMLADGERRGVYSRRQVLANVVLLMNAGHNTTLNLICNGVLAFIRAPDQWDLLRGDPDGLCASAVEECLRYEPPVTSLWRISTQDLELGGKLIRAGDRVLWVIASANRDPAAFADPDAFDVTRSPNPHVALGGGIHHCLGAALARLEGQEVFKALAETFPRLHLEGDAVEYLPSAHVRSLSALPVCWN